MGYWKKEVGRLERRLTKAEGRRNELDQKIRLEDGDNPHLERLYDEACDAVNQIEADLKIAQHKAMREDD